ncbi:Cof-type HAD-IIB family hydrolase [Lentilactobacillus sp. SPB1-3]|uniref:Cof-type HAD-IIB family hydrolase n=1 Tax=Lentilactobacillus terminaliae TaxID=3003483 RepID=A0ACD5DC21_9LACO|nr:Cof-type HAD-IIB family hydrolase [Lentilactobacillus sp. SPB1-3]MCZ0977231.1 Cof-type HAD-IIB family hydrolase [Lentilactobacillus sp. SPB1-3]
MILIAKKLIALDLDGTTLNDKPEISEMTKQAIKAAQQDGYIVSIVTGRPNRISENFYDDLSLNTPMINFNGNLGILPHNRWELEYQYTIEKDIVMDLLEQSKQLGINLLAVEGRNMFLANHGAKSNLGFFPSVIKSDEILNQHTLTDNPISITVELQPDAKQAFIDYTETKFGDAVDVAPWGGPHPIVEVTTKGIKKSTGLKVLADYFGVSQKDIYAFGDEANDLSMISYAGHGIAMKNAIPSIKDIATDVTDYTNDQNGVAKYLRDHMDIAVGL